MGDRLNEIRERWAGVKQLRAGRMWWARDVMLSGVPKNADADRNMAHAIHSAPEDVAWLVASLVDAQDLRATAERERDEARAVANEIGRQLKENAVLETQRDAALDLLREVFDSLRVQPAEEGQERTAWFDLSTAEVDALTRRIHDALEARRG